MPKKPKRRPPRVKKAVPKNFPALVAELEEALAQLPVLDAHTHLVGGKLAARGLHEILLYHMVITDLYAAGCPSGARLTQFPKWADQEEAHRRLQEALPYLKYIQNTSCFWGVRLILRDLYGWKEPVTAANWKKLDALIRERSAVPDWGRDILDKAKIRRSVTEWARREGGADDGRLQYSIEWGFFTRCQWGEYDTALYEVERCWGRQPESPAPIGGKRPAPERVIRSLEDVQEAVQWYVDHIPYGRVLSNATHVSTDIDYSPVSRDEMAAALARRSQAGPRERDIYASYINEVFINALEKHTKEIVFQFSIAAEPLPFETGGRLDQRTVRQWGDIMARHPDLRFQAHNASRMWNQAFCTFARELPNFSLAGYWWHNFFPGGIREIFSERLDMLPVNKQVGFFSDAYCVDWSYAKLVMVRKQMAPVLAEKIRQGQYTLDTALAVSRAILYDAPRELMGMAPRS
jgi:glucuronate isomerase